MPSRLIDVGLDLQTFLKTAGYVFHVTFIFVQTNVSKSN